MRSLDGCEADSRQLSAATFANGTSPDKLQPSAVMSTKVDEPVLVRSGLSLDECVTETCLAVKVVKRHASETLKLVCIH